MRIKINILIVVILLIFFKSYQYAEARYSSAMKQSAKLTFEVNGIKEYQLQNGLKILLKMNHSIPLVTFSIWYKVGSRNETDRNRGLAHFLEQTQNILDRR